ncbi:MAG TPA: hypothetical protein VJT31_38320, partial [Rugosimonospora sp.]|nr:hypothetical protein [Rugosimonospora sp.]
RSPPGGDAKRGRAAVVIGGDQPFAVFAAAGLVVPLVRRVAMPAGRTAPHSAAPGRPAARAPPVVPA